MIKIKGLTFLEELSSPLSFILTLLFDPRVLNTHTHSLSLSPHFSYVPFFSPTNQIQCWDSDPISPRYMNKQFTIYLTNVNEAPIDLKINNNSVGVSIDENLGIGHEVGIVTAIDPDNEVSWQQNITMEILNENTTDVPFVLVGGDSVETTMNFDYEVKNSYTFNLTATDDGMPPLTTTRMFTITVSGPLKICRSFCFTNTFSRKVQEASVMSFILHPCHACMFILY